MKLSYNPTDPQTRMDICLLWAVRHATTRKLVEWLDENPTVRGEIADLVKHRQDPWIDEAALRAALHSRISPLHRENGPVLGLQCILVEGSLGLIDWPAVLASLGSA